MKQKIYMLGLATVILISLGILFKLNHWAGAGIMLTLGITVLVLVFTPAALVNSYKADAEKGKGLLYFVTWLTVLVVFAAMLFKIQHWPWAGVLMMISIPFPFVVFLPVFLISVKGRKDQSIYDTVSVLILLMIVSCFTVLLGLNVSKDRIIGSLGLMSNYNRSEEVLDNLKIRQESPVAGKINDLLVMSEEYRQLYLASSGISPDAGNTDEEELQRLLLYREPSGRFGGESEDIDARLLKGLGDLAGLLGSTPGCESLAAAAPSVFGLVKTPAGTFVADPEMGSLSIHPWLLVYLDGLENNLKSIRVEAGR